ncbi:MAG: hypothetical protein WC371_04665 [Parachlamydiales bacterium]|jgi:hypothetical protein
MKTGSAVEIQRLRCELQDSMFRAERLLEEGREVERTVVDQGGKLGQVLQTDAGHLQADAEFLAEQRRLFNKNSAEMVQREAQIRQRAREVQELVRQNQGWREMGERLQGFLWSGWEGSKRIYLHTPVSALLRMIGDLFRGAAAFFAFIPELVKWATALSFALVCILLLK